MRAVVHLDRVQHDRAFTATNFGFDLLVDDVREHHFISVAVKRPLRIVDVIVKR